MTPQLQKKVDFAIKLLQSIPNDDPIEVCYSGGKDSDVILELAKMAGINYRAIYKNTTIDPPGTVRHCKDKGVEVVHPRNTFLQLVEKKGIPTRFRRFCCKELKEYKILDRSIQGIRRSESTARKKRYHEPELCRTYSEGGKARIYLPILEWTDKDVAEFIADRGIKCHPLYYDEDGGFHVECRLGCIGCPMQSDNGRGDFIKYPKMLKVMMKALQRFIDTHPHSKIATRYKDASSFMFFRFFFERRHPTFQGALDAWENAMTGGMFPETAIDPKKFLEDYFGIDLTI